jgi:hypothetical protein
VLIGEGIRVGKTFMPFVSVHAKSPMRSSKAERYRFRSWELNLSEQLGFEQVCRTAEARHVELAAPPVLHFHNRQPHDL